MFHISSEQWIKTDLLFSFRITISAFIWDVVWPLTIPRRKRTRNQSDWETLFNLFNFIRLTVSYSKPKITSLGFKRFFHLHSSNKIKYRRYNSKGSKKSFSTQDKTSLMTFSCQGAFRRKSLWKALGISTVIVNHIVLLHPFDSGLPSWVQWLFHPWLVLWVTGSTRGTWRSPNASLCIEVGVGGSEWGLAPICLHKPTSRGPVICVPKTGV